MVKCNPVINKLILLTELSSINSLYDKTFEKFVVTVKSKTLENPWITKGIIKSSNINQGLYDKFLKSKIYGHEIRLS